MEESDRSVTMTCVLVLVLTALNYKLWTPFFGFSFQLAWPILGALFVWIASRIWHGHNKL